MGNSAGRQEHTVIIVLHRGFLLLLFWDLQRLVMIPFVPFWYVSCWPQKSALLIFQVGYIYTSELVCSRNGPVPKPPAIRAGAGTDYTLSGLCIHQSLCTRKRCPHGPGKEGMARVHIWTKEVLAPLGPVVLI